ncbi:hypothetical protein EIN_135180 [Entamoeba invadens IP1]|uniref:TLDc domain-containing protein n=1 Tax=Entamoeba invadens IP1 TaxID=370355 RepID=A0A0A1U303_ENTIV|nr:hypothetical protein EIN_135180 [Entamoeba invadens IP1]ELP85934.1 hypothetical protein EIN_135180 [Entamoeba invadens IP1]|eukprot:XP_004185280.1 hypothetical protein EIN_135180 [Entamoeba invadens IP1]
MSMHSNRNSSQMLSLTHRRVVSVSEPKIAPRFVAPTLLDLSKSESATSPHNRQNLIRVKDVTNRARLKRRASHDYNCNDGQLPQEFLESNSPATGTTPLILINRRKSIGAFEVEDSNSLDNSDSPRQVKEKSCTPKMTEMFNCEIDSQWSFPLSGLSKNRFDDEVSKITNTKVSTSKVCEGDISSKLQVRVPYIQFVKNTSGVVIMIEDERGLVYGFYCYQKLSPSQDLRTSEKFWKTWNWTPCEEVIFFYFSRDSKNIQFVASRENVRISVCIYTNYAAFCAIGIPVHHVAFTNTGVWGDATLSELFKVCNANVPSFGHTKHVIFAKL